MILLPLLPMERFFRNQEPLAMLRAAYLLIASAQFGPRLFLSLAVALGCSSNSQQPRIDSAEEGFERAIFPLLEAARCGDCHTEQTRVARHWSLTTPAETYAQWVGVPGFNHCGPNGEEIDVPIPDQIRVIPGDPDDSLVIKKLTAPWENCGLFYGHMPPSPEPRLETEKIDRIRAWIAAGAER